MTQLRCCDCDAPFPGLTEEEAQTKSDEVQCERCFRDRMGWGDEPEQEMPF